MKLLTTAALVITPFSSSSALAANARFSIKFAVFRRIFSPSNGFNSERLFLFSPILED